MTRKEIQDTLYVTEAIEDFIKLVSAKGKLIRYFKTINMVPVWYEYWFVKLSESRPCWQH